MKTLPIFRSKMTEGGLVGLGLARSAAAHVLPVAMVGLAACTGSSFAQSPGAAADAKVESGDGGAVVVGIGPDGSTRGSGRDAGVEASAPPPPTIVYVSSDGGVDTNDGLSPRLAKKTIASGIVAAAALTGGEVHVCKGVYVEPALSLDAPVSLKGGYDCVQWTRTAGYGYPTFDDVSETIIQNGNYAAQAATLVVSGSVPASVVIDGFTIQGAPWPVATGPTLGIAIQDRASPVVSNCDITGGDGTQFSSAAGANPGSIGLNVSGSASPEVTMTRVNGGNGSCETKTSQSYGSAGVVLAGTGTPNLHDLTISGGVAAFGGSVGLLSSVSLTKAGGNALVHATIDGADYQQVPPTFTDGVSFEGTSSADILDSSVSGDTAPSADPKAYATAVTLAGGTVLLSGDRIYGGSNAYGTMGVRAGTVEMSNSIVHAGEGNYGAGLVANDAMTLSFDTIYTPHGATPYLIGGTFNMFGAQTYGTGQVTSVLFLGGGPEVAVVGSSCADSPPASFTTIDHSVFGGFQADGLCMGTCGNEFGGLGLVSGTQTANSDLSAAMCGTSCAKALFASWGSDDGMSALLSSGSQSDAGAPQGWTFAPNPPCVIAKGGAPGTGVTTDIDGNPRSATPSVGAMQVVGGCAP
jgi:hypothetical protein